MPRRRRRRRSSRTTVLVGSGGASYGDWMVTNPDHWSSRSGSKLALRISAPQVCLMYSITEIGISIDTALTFCISLCHPLICRTIGGLLDSENSTPPESDGSQVRVLRLLVLLWDFSVACCSPCHGDTALRGRRSNLPLPFVVIPCQTRTSDRLRTWECKNSHGRYG